MNYKDSVIQKDHKHCLHSKVLILNPPVWHKSIVFATEHGSHIGGMVEWRIEVSVVS